MDSVQPTPISSPNSLGNSVNPSVHIPPVSDDVRKSHDGFVNNIFGMIQNVVLGVRGTIIKIVFTLFGWVSYFKPKTTPAHNSTSVDDSTNPIQAEEVQETPEVVNRTPAKPLSFEDLKNQFKEKTESNDDDMGPSTQVRADEELPDDTKIEPSPVQHPTVCEGSKVQTPVDYSKYPTLKKTRSVRVAIPLDIPLKKAKGKEKKESLTKEQKKIRKVIRKCIHALSSRQAKKHEGIFRLSGNKENTDRLFQVISQGKDIPNTATIDEIACAFKKYIELNIHFLQLNDIIAIGKSNDKKDDWIKLLNTLDYGNHLILKRIIRFLAKEIAANHTKNKMNAENLARTLGMNFVQVDDFSAIPFVQSAFTALIENYSEIFNSKKSS